MIVSHKHKFIYVKAHRVAGTSVHVELEKACGDGDLFSGDHSERNCELSPHATVGQVRDLVGEKVWQDYTKIVNVRNPWDMLVSLYFFTHNWTVKQSSVKLLVPALFGAFVRWHVSYSPRNKDFWLIEGEPWADVYIRYESLESDCWDLWYKLGLKWTGLQRLGSQHRQNGFHYSLMYDYEEMETVRKAYAREIEYFGYSFEHPYSKGDNVKWIV
jgi:hypothetical protein